MFRCSRAILDICPTCLFCGVFGECFGHEAGKRGWVEPQKTPKEPSIISARAGATLENVPGREARVLPVMSNPQVHRFDSTPCRTVYVKCVLSGGSGRFPGGPPIRFEYRHWPCF